MNLPVRQKCIEQIRIYLAVFTLTSRQRCLPPFGTITLQSGRLINQLTFFLLTIFYILLLYVVYMKNNNFIICSILKGHMESDTVDSACQIAHERGVSVLDVLAESGHSKQDLFVTMAEECGMESVVLTSSHPPQSAAQLIPAEIAEKYGIVPLHRVDGTLLVAIGDPSNMEVLDTLQYLFKGPITVLAAMPEQIENALARLYPEAPDCIKSMLIHLDGEASKPSEYNEEAGRNDRTALCEEPIVKLVNLLIIEGVRQRASDIQL